MSDRVYVGKKATSFESSPAFLPYSKVVVWDENDKEYTAGDDTGRTLEAFCPWATQEIANDMLAKIKGFVYAPFEAQGAHLNPAAELGDGSTVNGVYAPLASIATTFGRECVSDIAAPADEEIDHEIKYRTPSQRSVDRKISQTRSLITKTSEQIRMEVANEVEGLSASFDIQLDDIKAEIVGTQNAVSSIELSLDSIAGRIQDAEGNLASVEVTISSIDARLENAEGSIDVAISVLDGLTVTDSGGTTRIKGSSIETDTLYVNAANITGTLTADQINLTGAITWNDLASGVQSNINGAYSVASNAQSTANSAATAASNAQSTADSASTTASYAYNLADSAYDMALDTSDIVSDWSYRYGGTTYINGAMIMTGTVKASTLQGGTIGILNSYGTQIGYMSVGSSTSAGLQLVSGGNLFLSSASCFIQMSGSNMSVSCSYFYPTGSAPYLGYSGKGMWQAVYAYTGAIQTSDRNLKHDIEDLPDKYLDMLLSLHPRRYKMDNGTSNRYHVGFIAQEVEEAMELYEIDSLEFAGFITDVDTEGNEIYMLRYEEFIAIHTLAVQRIYQRLEMAGI